MRLITKAQMSELARVTAAAITKATKGELAPALVGNHIDVEHSAVAAYLVRALVRPRAPGGERTSAAVADDEIDELADLALRVLGRLIVRARRGRKRPTSGSVVVSAPTSEPEEELLGDGPET